MVKKTKVSVVMITYGHEKYIKEAIEGVLMQEVSFDVKLTIANDCSPDSTEAIIKNIIASHPRGHWIEYVSHHTNIGMMANFVYALELVNSEYIALCEGDDYWTDSLKLQKQVDFLDTNSNYDLITHNSIKFDQQTQNKIEMNVFENSFEFSLKHLLNREITVPTASILFRNFNSLPDWFITCKVGDWPLLIILLEKSNGYFINETMGVYRKQENGVSNTLNKDNHYLILLDTFLIINKHFKNELINKEISKVAYNAFIYDFGHFKYSFKLFFLALKYNKPKTGYYLMNFSKKLLKKILKI